MQKTKKTHQCSSYNNLRRKHFQQSPHPQQSLRWKPCFCADQQGSWLWWSRSCTSFLKDATKTARTGVLADIFNFWHNENVGDQTRLVVHRLTQALAIAGLKLQFGSGVLGLPHTNMQHAAARTLQLNKMPFPPVRENRAPHLLRSETTRDNVQTFHGLYPVLVTAPRSIQWAASNARRTS